MANTPCSACGYDGDEMWCLLYLVNLRWRDAGDHGRQTLEASQCSLATSLYSHLVDFLLGSYPFGLNVRSRGTISFIHSTKKKKHEGTFRRRVMLQILSSILYIFLALIFKAKPSGKSQWFIYHIMCLPFEASIILEHVWNWLRKISDLDVFHVEML